MAKKKSDSTASAHRQTLDVTGMTCRSCEMLIEKKLKVVPGVVDVRASERLGEVEIFTHSDANVPLHALEDALDGTPYRIRLHTDILTISGHSSKWMEAGGSIILVLALYQILKRFDVISLSAPSDDVFSLSAVFAVGLVAASSTCLAVVGGLLLSVSAKWTESHQTVSRWDKFRPLLMFNVGRLAGYFLLGGIVGILGTAITLTTQATGMLTIVIAVVMIMLGLNILRILPKRYCTIPLPRSFQQRIHNLSESHHPVMPGVLGALTFFLPCGFTQSMQLLALGSGGFLEGGTIMFIFALGTLPALLGLSIVSSVAEGGFARYFIKFSGAVVLLLGIINFNSGLLLNGVDAKTAIYNSLGMTVAHPTSDPNVMVNAQGQQIITMYVSDTGYSPNSFTIDPGKETWVYAVAPTGVTGCANFMTAPTFGLTTQIKQGENWLGPIVNPQKSFVVTCSMGMLRANINVRSL